MSSSKKPPKNLRTQAVQAALRAGEILRKYFGKTFSLREKPRAGLVTQADEEAQAAACRILKKVSAEMGFLAEETLPADLRAREASAGRWIIDPLDGTTNFVHGYPAFCVSIAAECMGKLQVGVI